MAKYGQAAEVAARLLAGGEVAAPWAAWDTAVVRVFPDSPSARAKGCPRNAILALCELGAIDGAPLGEYTRSVKNKAYAIRGEGALRANPGLCDDEDRLWKMVTRGAAIVPNHQMDVVATLWRKNLIRPPR